MNLRLKLSVLAKNLRHLDPAAVTESIETIDCAIMKLELLESELKSAENAFNLTRVELEDKTTALCIKVDQYRNALKQIQHTITRVYEIGEAEVLYELEQITTAALGDNQK